MANVMITVHALSFPVEGMPNRTLIYPVPETETYRKLRGAGRYTYLISPYLPSQGEGVSCSGGYGWKCTVVMPVIFLF